MAGLASFCGSRLTVYGLRGLVGLEDPDEGEVAVGLGKVQTVAHDEMVVDGEAQVVHGNVLVSGDPLLQEGANLDGLGMTRAQDLDDLVQRRAGVHDVFHDDDFAARDVGGEVAHQPDVARGLGRRSGGGDLEKVQRYGRFEPLGEIAEEEDRALEDAHEEQGPTVLVPVHFRGDPGHPFLQGVGVDQGAAELHGNREERESASRVTMNVLAIITMSAEAQSLERDYIRLTERFKALSTFDEFLQGIHRAFLPIQSRDIVDLGPLYEELKRLSEAARAGTGEPPAELLRDLEVKFDAAGSQLRAVDIQLSPSLTRRYFEKVRPSDQRIPFYLLRFYALYPQTDEDLLDKVDYLATMLAAGSPDPAAPLQRSRGEVRELFDTVLNGSAWPRVDDDTAAEIARAFDEVAAQLASVTGFGSLAEEGWIESLRNF